MRERDKEKRWSQMPEKAGDQERQVNKAPLALYLFFNPCSEIIYF